MTQGFTQANGVFASEQHEAIIAFVRELLLDPGARVNIERGKNRLRLRFYAADRKTGKTVRSSVELPMDNALLSTLDSMLAEYRKTRRTRHTTRHFKWQKELKRRVTVLSPRGRVVRRRIGLVFDLAAGLGYETLHDFLGRKPWLTTPLPPGRHRAQL